MSLTPVDPDPGPIDERVEQTQMERATRPVLEALSLVVVELGENREVQSKQALRVTDCDVELRQLDRPDAGSQHDRKPEVLSALAPVFDTVDIGIGGGGDASVGRTLTVGSGTDGEAVSK